MPGENGDHLFRHREREQWCFDLRSLYFAHSLWHLDDTVVDSVRRGRRDFSHGLTEAGLTHDKLRPFSLWVNVHDILVYFCIPGSTVVAYQEVEPASRVFVTTYYGFPKLNKTHIRRPSLSLYDAHS